jgi:hypothetical protein
MFTLWLQIAKPKIEANKSQKCNVINRHHWLSGQQLKQKHKVSGFSIPQTVATTNAPSQTMKNSFNTSR